MTNCRWTSGLFIRAAIVVLSMVFAAGAVRADEAEPPEDDGRILVEGGDALIGLHRDEMTERIENSIRRACLYLKKTQARDGSWIPRDSTIRNPRRPRAQFGNRRVVVNNFMRDRVVGANGIVVMGLLYAGVNADNPTVLRGLGFLAKNQKDVDFTYTRGVIACAFCLADPHRKNEKMAGIVEDNIEWLLKAQAKNPYHLWQYRFNSRFFDFSCTQFAVEALRMAEQQGYRVPRKHLTAVRKAIHTCHLPDGMWPYSWNPRMKNVPALNRRGRKTMTAATLACLAWLDARLADPQRDAFRPDPHLVKGLEAVNRIYDGMSEEDAVGIATPHYLAYCYERAGVLTGTRYFGGRDWYREIAAHIIKGQDRSGAYEPYTLTRDEAFDTAFGTGFYLLFLGKGLAPTIVGRLDWGPTSKGTLHDMGNLTDALTRELGRHLNWVTVPIEADAGEYKKVPLLYITGNDDPFDDLMKHRDTFDAYLEAGGTLLAAGFKNRPEFERGFKKFVKTIRPGTTFEELPLKHTLYRRWHEMDKPHGLVGSRTPKVARPLALLVTEPFAAPLNRGGGRDYKEAAQLGVNTILYLTQLDKRTSFLDDIMPPREK